MKLIAKSLRLFPPIDERAVLVAPKIQDVLAPETRLCWETDRGRSRSEVRTKQRVVQSTPSLAEIFGTYADFVWQKLLRFGVPDCDVDDVTQEVFVVVQRKLPTFEGRSSLRTWLYGICLRQAADYRRKARHRREELMDTVPDSLFPTASEPPPQYLENERADIRRELLRALDKLSEEQRQVFILYEIEELPMSEVAQIVGCELFTAYSRLQAARATLKRRMVARGISL